MSLPTSLRRVDKLRIKFLVDNTIEWFTKLPSGFVHELPQHVRLDAREDEVTGAPTLDFNKFCCGAHGFSALIETEVDGEESHLTLFDTGPDSLSLVRNIGGLQVPVEKIERVILSHWHSDHTGGLLSFLNLRKTPGCVVDVHPDRPFSRGIAPGPTYDKVLCALPKDPTFEEIQKTGAVIEKHAEGHTVADGTVWVSGEIPRVTPWEQGILGGKRWVDGSSGAKGSWITEEHIMDERYAAIDVLGKGLVVFSACSHAGIVNVVKDAVDQFKRPVYMVIGGLHLAPSDFVPRIQPTVDFLSKQLIPSPTYVLPMHCSGFQSKIALEEALGDGCVPAGVGLHVEVEGSKEADERLFPARYQSRQAFELKLRLQTPYQ